MDFEFDMTLEFDTISFMFFAYPQIFDDGCAVLEVIVEVENYKPHRDAPNIKNTEDARFYDDGDKWEADVKLFAEIDGERTKLPDCLIVEQQILDDVEAEGLQRSADNKLDRELERRGARYDY